MSKIIQIQVSVLGDNVTSKQEMITTALYDDGSIYEGSMQSVSGDFNNGFKYEMVWTMVSLPNRD